MVAQRHRRARTWLAAGPVTALAPLLLVTGCSDDDTAAASDRSRPRSSAASQPYAASGLPRPRDPGDEVRAAAETQIRYGTSRTRTSMAMASGGTRIAVEGEGAFDYRSGEGRLVVRLPEGTSGARPGERRTVTELAVPGGLYMKNRGAGIPADKWVRVKTGSLRDGNLLSAGATDPGSAAELLRGAREVTYEGTARTGGGTLVRRYRGTVDLAAAARAASPRRRDELEAAARGFAVNTVPFDAQIDGQGRLRKVRHHFTFAGGAPDGTDGMESGAGGDAGRGRSDRDENGGGEGRSGGGVAVASTTWFYGYGVPVEVVMPDPEDIYAGEIAPF